MTDKSDFGPIDAKSLFKTGMSQVDIGLKLGVSAKTVARWKRNGWKRLNRLSPEEELARQTAAVEKARQRADQAITSGRVAAMERDVSDKTDAELLKETARRTLITVCAALEYGKSNASELVKKKPRDFGAFLDHCGQAVSKAHEGWDRYLGILRDLHGKPAENVTPVAAKMDEEDPMREVMARLETSINARKKAADAVPGSSSVQ